MRVGRKGRSAGCMRGEGQGCCGLKPWGHAVEPWCIWTAGMLPAHDSTLLFMLYWVLAACGLEHLVSCIVHGSEFKCSRPMHAHTRAHTHTHACTDTHTHKQVHIYIYIYALYTHV